MSKKNLILVYTGNGKGKTTAALGTLWRALGHGLQCAVVQFVKKQGSQCGEYLFARKLDVPWFVFGEGFTWQQEDLGPSIQAAKKGWEFVQEEILRQRLDLLILDEFTYPLDENWICVENVVNWLSGHRDVLPHLVITGRRAPQQLVNLSDTATEMRELHHCFSKQGLPARRGIDY